VVELPEIDLHNDGHNFSPQRISANTLLRFKYLLVGLGPGEGGHMSHPKWTQPIFLSKSIHSWNRGEK
jgi:hypothetical protein